MACGNSLAGYTTPCADNNPGITRFFAILRQDVSETSFPTPDATTGLISTTPGGVSGKAFVEYEFARTAATLNTPVEGVKKGLGQRSRVIIDLAHLSQELIQEVKLMANQDMVLGVVDENDRCWVIGTISKPSELEPGEGGTQTRGDNFNGQMLNFYCSAPPAEYHDGVSDRQTPENISAFITSLTTPGS